MQPKKKPHPPARKAMKAKGKGMSAKKEMPAQGRGRAPMKDESEGSGMDMLKKRMMKKKGNLGGHRGS